MSRIISGILWFCSGTNFQLTSIVEIEEKEIPKP